MALPLGLKPGLKAKTIVERETEHGKLTEEYAATCLAYAVVYRKDGVAIKNAEVPEEVKEQLNATMLMGAGNPPELGIVSEPVDPEVAQAAANLELQARVEAAKPAPIVVPNEDWQPSSLEDKSIEDEFGFDGVAPEIDLSAELEAAEARSVDNVNLRELVKALYERFGVYTVYLNKAPSRDEINPLTGAAMNTLTLGQANQGFRVAQRTGTSWNPEVMKSQINAARAARSTEVALPESPMVANQVVGGAYGEEVHMPNLHGEPDRHYNRRYESPHKSVVQPVRGKENDGTDPDEVYAEPPINARTAIVRPFVNNKRSQEQLERISSRRVQPGQSGISFNDLV